MKIVAFILCVFVAVQGQSQEKIVDELNLQIFCGYGAQTSKDIQAFKTFVALNDTINLRNKLFDGSKLEQILSAITLKHYQVNGSLQLTQLEQKKVVEISKLKDKFSLCYTCTFHQEGTVKELFSRRKYSSSYAIIESFLSNKL